MAKKAPPAPDADVQAEQAPPEPQPETEAPPSPPSRSRLAERQTSLDEIVARRNADFLADTGVDPTSTAIPDVEPPPAPAAEEAETQTQAGAAPAEAETPATRAAPTEPAPAPSEPPPRLIKLKINGREVEKTEEEVIALAQKSGASDFRFQEGLRMMREAEALRQQQAPPPQPQPAQAPSEATPLDRKAIARAIMTGDEAQVEQAVFALEQQIRTQSQPAPTQQVDPVDIEERIKDDIDRETSLERIKSEYPHVFQDERAVWLAAQFARQYRENAILQIYENQIDPGDVRRWNAEAIHRVYSRLSRQGAVAPTADVYREACKAVDEFRGRGSQPEPKTEQPRPASIVEAKRAAPRQPQPASQRSRLGPDEPERTPHAVAIAETRRRPAARA